MQNIKVSNKKVHSEDFYQLPSDKSISHRVLLISSIIDGKSEIYNINKGIAVQLLINELKKIGIKFSEVGNKLIVMPPLGGIKASKNLKNLYINLGPSSAAARMLIGVLAGCGINATVDGNDTLRNRPMEWIIEPLRKLGMDIRYDNVEGRLPITIQGGKLHAGNVEVNIGSAQAYSTLLLAGFTAGININIKRKVCTRDHTENLLMSLGAKIESKQTEICYKHNNFRNIQEYYIPIDPSAVAYPIAAHIFQRRKSELRIENVCINPTRIGFFEVIKSCGISIEYEDMRNYYGEKIGTVVVKNSDKTLKPFRVNDEFLLHSMIDEIPLLCAFATLIDGESVILGAVELTFKETDRLLTTRDMLSAFGANIEVIKDGIYIKGGKKLTSGVVPSFMDHRIAMTAVVVGSSLQGETTISDGTCFETSFMNFDNYMQTLGFDVKRA